MVDVIFEPLAKLQLGIAASICLGLQLLCSISVRVCKVGWRKGTALCSKPGAEAFVFCNPLSFANRQINPERSGWLTWKIS